MYTMTRKAQDYKCLTGPGGLQAKASKHKIRLFNISTRQPLLHFLLTRHNPQTDCYAYTYLAAAATKQSFNQDDTLAGFKQPSPT